MPTTIKYPRDTAIGTSLTDWVYSTTNSPRTCTSELSKSVSAMVDSGSLTPVSGLTVKNSVGVSVTVWETGLAGVGLALTASVKDCGMTAFINVPGWVAGCMRPGGTYTLTLQTQLGAKYVVTGPMSPGKIEPKRVAKQLPTFGQIGKQDENYYLYYNLTATTIDAPACTTPNVTVALGNQSADTLLDAGSTTSPVSFTLNVNNCAKDINTIKYKLYSAQAQATLPGVIGPSSSSTSTGIGVKLMKPDGSAVPIDGTKMDVSGYNTTVGGNLTIPLKAAMYRLSSKRPTAGTLSAEVEFTMYYE